MKRYGNIRFTRRVVVALCLFVSALVVLICGQTVRADDTTYTGSTMYSVTIKSGHPKKNEYYSNDYSQTINYTSSSPVYSFIAEEPVSDGSGKPLDKRFNLVIGFCSASEIHADELSEISPVVMNGCYFYIDRIIGLDWQKEDNPSTDDDYITKMTGSKSDIFQLVNDVGFYQTISDYLKTGVKADGMIVGGSDTHPTDVTNKSIGYLQNVKLNLSYITPIKGDSIFETTNYQIYSDMIYNLKWNSKKTSTNQVNFAVPNMNPQNQNRINNNVQMGTNISGTYVETTSEKQMSMFGLLTHYSKENKQIYERQKAQRKAQKEAEKNGAAMPGQNVKPSNVSFAIPGQPPQQRPQPAQAQPQPVMPQLPQQQFAQPQRQFTQSNQPQRQFAQPQPMPQAQQKPAQQVQPQSVQNQNTNTGMTGNPSVPPQILENMTKAGNFGETTVLGVGSEAGETTVLGTSQAQIIKPYLLRIKNNERIELNKPVFRIGKERSYVDYFVSDNTAVSRSHANIINKDNEFYIVDTNSTNHTYVNGSMIQSNVETKIEHGTKIRLANEDFEFFMY